MVAWDLYGTKLKQSLILEKRTKINGVWYKKGELKGLLRIASERAELGASIKNLESLKRDELITELSKFKDFQNIKPKVVELIDKLNDELFKGEPGVVAEFLPKYYCEFAEVEMFWRNGKYTFRKENDREWKTITRRVNSALDKLPVSFFAKIFRQVKAIEIAYDEGNTTAEELLHLKETADFRCLHPSLSYPLELLID